MTRRYNTTGRYDNPDVTVVEEMQAGRWSGARTGLFAERLEAARRLSAAGMSASQVAARVGRCLRTVQRWQARWGIGALPRGRFNGATRPVDPIMPWEKKV